MFATAQGFNRLTSVVLAVIFVVHLREVHGIRRSIVRARARASATVAEQLDAPYFVAAIASAARYRTT